MKEIVGVPLQPQIGIESIASQGVAEQPPLPNLLSGLPDGFELPRDRRGRIRWSILAEDPSRIKEVIEIVAQNLLMAGFKLSPSSLRRSELSAFDNGISTFYPGGYSGLKEKLGLRVRKPKSRGFWTPVTIEQEAGIFLRSTGRLSESLLLKEGRNGLRGAIKDHYPGGLRQLKEDLGQKAEQRPTGYWSRVNIEEEARRFLEENGDLSYSKLKQRSGHALSMAIAKNYEGGIRHLRINLGIGEGHRGKGYWTEEETCKEAQAFLDQEGDLNYNLLLEKSRYDLKHAIIKYPGRIRQLRSDLGIENRGRRYAYWVPAQVEKEAREFFENNGILNFVRLREMGRNDLAVAIVKYPGGSRALKEKLGIDQSGQPSIPPDQANEQLQRLLESGGIK